MKVLKLTKNVMSDLQKSVQIENTNQLLTDSSKDFELGL